MYVTGSSPFPWSFWLQAPLATRWCVFFLMRNRPRALSKGQLAVHCPIVLQPAPTPGFSTVHLLVAFLVGVVFTVTLVVMYILLQ